MSNTQNILVGHIDPDSTVNVRRKGIEDNVEKIKESIERHGYWPEHPIVVRAHPNAESPYKYEHVIGQCRFKACLASGVTEIPAFILELNDEQAIQRSWGENEARGDLAYSDKSHWVEKICKKYTGNGKTAQEALKLAADYLSVTVQTAMTYYSLSVLPEDLNDMVDKGSLPIAVAKDLVTNTYKGGHVEKSQQTMRDRSDWYLGIDRTDRKYAQDVLKNCGHEDPIEKLQSLFEKKSATTRRTMEYIIPEELHSDLLKWGKERGLETESEIVGLMVVNAIKG